MLPEPAGPHRAAPGIPDFARGGLPAPAATDDGNRWVDGSCWLYCGRRWTRVLWVGPVNVAGVQAPMYACGPCIRKLQEQVWQAVLLNDAPTRSAQPGAPAGAEPPGRRRGGRHRARGGFPRRG
ncbi:hypothetical protein F0L17_13825 [Streptomyces sp. TRM43335]|uniref:Uncharacterized protein n=1 Tax=Streptomyces taklimakanensis TaxID=2569853 RepID=A0A6G2BDL4_9ACTN|nr:hypothetical protein [Streptomyces taklimakanensis]